ncbi:MAG: hypothetical protein ACYDCQ_16135 [Dehalococcoidia bacterium]
MTDASESQQVLDVLACAIDKRPPGAASIFDVAPAVLAVRRDGGVLEIEFDGSAAAAVSEFVAAERVCCAEIDWDLATDPAVHQRLRISATPAQIDLLAELFAQSGGKT